MKVVIENTKTEQKPDVVYDACDRKGVRKQPMELEEAYALLKEAYDEYNLAIYIARHAKKGHSKFVSEKEHEAELVANRVRNIVDECPQLEDFAQDGFLSPHYFESDFKELMEKLKMIMENKQ